MTQRRSRLVPFLAACLLALSAVWHVSGASAAPVDSDHDGIYDSIEGTVDVRNDT